jgi:hypothetical protein
MARSRTLALAAMALLGGCNLVFGVEGETTPCELGSFADATPVDLAPADDFSADWNMTFAVVMSGGVAHELDLETLTMTPIDLGPYSPLGVALAPEGNSLFYTASAEPNFLKGALRSGVTQWVLDATTPRGAFAGTPSADVFGPRRVLVKERDLVDEIQEYEDVAGRWMPVGPPHPVPTRTAPNLTPNGLTMVFIEHDAAGSSAIRASQRASISEWFGPPTTLREGVFRSAQLLGECKRLYTTEDAMLRQLDR